MTSNSKTSLLTGNKQQLQLPSNEIHLWFIKPQDFLGSDELLSRYSSLLSPEETIKQQRYKFENDRHDALITRAFIRDLLSYYAEVLPQNLEFERNEKGKPELVNFPIPLRFNLSHTKGLIVCAVTLTDDIGCDTENMSRNNNVLAIANRYFSKTETTELFSLAEEKQQDRFFDYWTLKESYIKAWGLGLAIPLADFSFHLHDSPPIKLDKFNVNSAIEMSFAKHREDNPTLWRNWLIYPNEHQGYLAEETTIETYYRIAISLRSSKNNQSSEYNMRFFNSSPLNGYQEL